MTLCECVSTSTGQLKAVYSWLEQARMVVGDNSHTLVVVEM